MTFFFLLKAAGNVSLAALGMILVMLPLFFLAMYEKDGQPLEVVAKHFIQAKFLRPKVRPYQTDNSNFCEILQILGVIHFLSGSRDCKSYASISHLWSLLLYLVTPKSHIEGDESNEYNFK